MDSPEFYFARDEEGADAGRKTIDELAALAREDRLAGVSVSENGKDGWRPASSIRELELDWVAEVLPGQFYGPVRKDVLDGYLKGGQIPPGARLYGAGAKDACAAAEAAAARIRDLESAVAARDAALEAMKKQNEECAETTRRTLATLEERLARLHAQTDADASAASAREAEAAKRAEAAESALAAAEARAAELGAQIAALNASVEAAEAARRKAEEEAASAKSALDTKETVWSAEKSTLESQVASLRSQQDSLQSEITRTEDSATALKSRVAELERNLSGFAAKPAAETVEAEIVEAPRRGPVPSASPSMSLADLERRARQELERMGSKGRKSFFGRK